MTTSPTVPGSTFVRKDCVVDGRSVPFFRFARLQAQPTLSHGVFTRRGGVSRPPFRSLNVGSRTSDRPSSVRANLERIRRVLGAGELIFLEQAHSRELVSIRRGEADRLREPVEADGLITDTPGLGLVIKQADCQAVILFDPVRRVVANVHCGWRGSVANILGAAVERMKREFGCSPGDLLAAVGPSLGPCCGEFKGYKEIFPRAFRAFMVRPDHFDLWALSGAQLAAAGVNPSSVMFARVCTRCRTDLFFSYRGEGDTGRFATVAMITDFGFRIS
ncbi:MAG: peptidoglycan editing factor PgeF [Deltaproteobacteria bacterium]|nr:peptidoglycan editing factor PgeF [Deltaproteobacteria bacterium]